MLSYSAQLAYIHVEFYIHQLINSMPELADMPQTAPVTGKQQQQQQCIIYPQIKAGCK